MIKNILIKILVFLRLSEQTKNKYVNYKYQKYYKNYSIDISFYKDFIHKNNIVFDIGANKGNKTNIFLKLGANVIAVEPDKKNLEILNSRFSKNKKLSIVNQIVSEKEGLENLYIVNDGDELNTCSTKWRDIIENNTHERFSNERSVIRKEEVKTTTIKKLIKLYGKPNFIKIDVEGFELNVIRGINETIPMISFESNLPDFLNESKECIRLISSLNKNYIFNYTDTKKFQKKSWLNNSEMINELNNINLKCIEIFAKIKKLNI